MPWDGAGDDDDDGVDPMVVVERIFGSQLVTVTTWTLGCSPERSHSLGLVTLNIRYGLLRPCRWRSTCDRGFLLKR